ncbi:MAG: nucleoside hydrolase [bacterium]
MKKHLTFQSLVLFLVILPFVSCNKNEKIQNPPEVPLIILDTDIGSSTDDLFAMEILYRYQEQGRCRLLGIVVDREGEDCAACADIMDTYFGHGNIPIGLVRNGIKNPTVFIDYRPLPTHLDTNGQLLFKHSVTNYASLPDGWQLYRQLLASQPDHSVNIVSIGFLTCLAQLLESESDQYSSLNGVELVRRKVNRAYLMGGGFNADSLGYNFAEGPTFTRTFFSLWPTEVDIVFSPGDVGGAIEYPSDSVIADISWTQAHPIKQVYLRYQCNTGQKMWDPLAVINAIEGDSLFTLSERGTVTMTEDNHLPFTPSPTGNCRYQMSGTAAWNATMLEKIRTYNKIH